MERHETQSTQTDRERKPVSNREDKKEKSATLDWGDSPYPVEPKSKMLNILMFLLYDYIFHSKFVQE